MAMQKLVLLLLIASLFGLARPDITQDKAECTDQLMSLSVCLTYIQGEAPRPAPDCCKALKDVLGKSLKCVCVLIRDRDDPNLGIKLNVTLAMAMPSKCKTPADMSLCPKMLNLPPHSKDAEIFEQYEKQYGNSTESSHTTNGAGNSDSKNGGGTSGANSTAPAPDAKNGVGAGMKWLGIEVGGGGRFFFYRMSLVALFVLGG